MFTLHIELSRKRKGLSISELAQASGVPKSEISKLEKWGGNPTLNTINKLARVLGPGILTWKGDNKR